MSWQDFIIPALEKQTTHGLEHVQKAIDEGFAQLWECPEGAAITEVIDYPLERWLTIWLTGGDMEKLFDAVLPRIEEHAKREKCHRVALGGRIGWNRVMLRHGYSPIGSVCAKEMQ